MDGSRTGVLAPNATNVTECMGIVKGRSYYAPNGRKFRKGSTKDVAKLMIEAQPSMAYVKEVVGYSPKAMKRRGPECGLYDFAADIVREGTEKALGRHVDIGMINSGGIRVDMPEGEVILDDILSMFPFKNYLCYVALKGSDVRKFFAQMASRHIMPISGVTLTVKNRELIDIKVGGEPIDDEKVYGFATVDFLLDGGDNVAVAKDAIELIKSDKLMNEAVLEHLKVLKEQGKPIEMESQGRIIYVE